MTLAVTNRVALRFKPESTFGTIPGTGNNYALRITNESLKYAIRTTQSNELRSDRMITDLIQTGASAEGDVAFEFSYGEFDSLLASALQGSWTTVSSAGVATGTAAYTTTSVTLTGVASPFTNVATGQWFRILDPNLTTNNGWYKASAVTATSLTIASAGFTAGTTTGSAQVQSARIANGTSQTSFAIERYSADITQYQAFRGMTPQQLSLTFQPGSVITGSVSFMGKDALALAGTSALPGTTTPSLTNSVYNSVANVYQILENGTALANTFAKSFQLQIANNLRAQEALGVLGAAGIGAGQCAVTGTLELYFADAVYLNKFVNNTPTNLSLRVSASSTGIGYTINLPNLRYTDGGTPTPGANQEVVLALPFQAIRDSTSGIQVSFDRGGDAVTPWAA